MADIAEQMAQYLGKGIRPNLLSADGIAPFGLRHGTPTAKGMGYFGPVGQSSELSAESDIGEHPLMVPGLSAEELRALVAGEHPTEAIYRKAEQHARQRIGSGKSTFAGPGELRYPLPEGY